MEKKVKKFLSITKSFTIFFVILFLAACNSKNDSVQGYVEGDYSYIASAVAGNLTKKFVERGDQVVLGQPLFVLDPQPETAKLEQAKSQLTQATQQLLDIEKGARSTIIDNIQAQLQQAEATRDLAQKTLERYQKLIRSAAIDKASLDQARTQYEEALQKVKGITAQLAEAKLGARENQVAAQKAAVSAADAAVKQAEWLLLQKSVRAAVNAEVFNTVYEVGEFVGAGQPVVVLLPPEKIKFIFFVSEKKLSAIKIGEEVTINCDNCKNSYKAKVTFISPNSEFTPPVIFSKDSRDKLVYRIEAKATPEVAKTFHPGQPIDVILRKNNNIEG